MRAKWLHRRAVNREHVAMRREPIRLLAVGFLPLLGVAVIEHLHLDAAQERLTWRADRRPPHEHAGVATAAQMPPLGFDDEILVVPQRAQRADGLPCTMNVSILHRPRFR